MIKLIIPLSPILAYRFRSARLKSGEVTDPQLSQQLPTVEGDAQPYNAHERDDGRNDC